MLHSSGGCFSKSFNALNFNTSDYVDVPIRNDGALCGEDDFLITEIKNYNFLAVADGKSNLIVIFPLSLIENHNFQV